MRSLKSTLAGFSAAILGLAVAANAAPVPWSNPSGAVPGLYSWSNGQSDNGLFGSPIVAGNSFTFFPINFRAVSSNGVAQTTTDRLSFTLEVAPGNPFFEGITVVELGDWAITNGGHVSSDAFLYVTNLNSPVNPPFNPLTGSGSFDANLMSPPSSGSGNWNITINRSLPAAPNGWTRIQVILDNILQATSPVGGTAIIEKKVGGITIFIPEPASMSLLAGLGTLAIRRRK
jgi:hypothetical protein